jgi:hypothetical protein
MAGRRTTILRRAMDGSIGRQSYATWWRSNSHGALILEMAGQKDANVTMTNARRGQQYLREVARRIALSSTSNEPLL